MPNYNVGQSFHTLADGVASKPKWIQWQSGLNNLYGNAKLPSGHRRLVYLDTSDERQKSDMYVVPLTQSATGASWRMVIYAPNGSYIKSTGTGDVPTIGTPTVRIGVNAPSKAVVRIPVMKDTSGNILASTFAGWSDGHTGAVDRGMELTVEYRDASTGTMRMAFRGMIYQIESGDVITITAYDRLMDLAQYSDQYQSHAGYTQNDTSVSRTTSGSNYVYQMNNSVGTLLTASVISVGKIDCLSAQSWDYGHTKYHYYIRHGLPSSGGHSLAQGYKITQLSVKYTAYYTWTRLATHSVKVSGKFLLYRNGEVIEQTNGGQLTEFISKTETNVTNITASGTLTINVDWTIDGDPSEYMIGAYVEGPRDSLNVAGGSWGYDYKSGFSTVSSVYQSDNGSTWSQLTGDHPEIAMKFTLAGGSVDTSSITVSGTSLTVASANVPSIASADYFSMESDDKGIQLIVSYFITGAAAIQGIIKDLLEWAGLTPDVVNENMGTATYYTTSTYDYMSCVLEFLKNGNYGLKASIDEPGKIIVRSRHTVSEAPSVTFTTNPFASGEQIILSHDLTAHWMAEKATQAYIAEDVTSSGLPVALETDDALMANSLVEIMESPLRSVIADSTLGTHNLQAYAAGGKMVQLHTNVFEGKITLAGYRLDIWDLSTGNVGGLPIGINVPEYGAQGTAVPTEIIIGDGVTQVSLDNIRTADRSEIANSMGLSADAISNSASAVPESVYIFARFDNGVAHAIPGGGLITNVKLYDEDGVVATQSSSTYLKMVNDNAGYCHILAIFPASAQPSGYAPVKPIQRVSAKWSLGEFIAVLDNPKYAYDGQNVHVDFRFERI